MKVNVLFMLVLLVLISSCTKETDNEVITMEQTQNNTKTAIFAGGCFWCMEAAYEGIDGVHEVVSGYIGGDEEDPSYKEVSSGTTGHYEAIQITYDPKKIAYKDLLDLFWRQIDPTDDDGQFADRGPQYRTVIFYQDEQQKKDAEESKDKLQNSGKFDKPIVTQILKATEFYLAEEYHQDYSKKRTIQYQLYKKGSGREGYIKKVWKDEE